MARPERRHGRSARGRGSSTATAGRPGVPGADIIAHQDPQGLGEHAHIVLVCAGFRGGRVDFFGATRVDSVRGERLTREGIARPEVPALGRAQRGARMCSVARGMAARLAGPAPHSTISKPREGRLGVAVTLSPGERDRRARQRSWPEADEARRHHEDVAGATRIRFLLGLPACRVVGRQGAPSYTL